MPAGHLHDSTLWSGLSPEAQSLLPIPAPFSCCCIFLSRKPLLTTPPPDWLLCCAPRTMWAHVPLSTYIIMFLSLSLTSSLQSGMIHGSKGREWQGTAHGLKPVKMKIYVHLFISNRSYFCFIMNLIHRYRSRGTHITVRVY